MPQTSLNLPYRAATRRDSPAAPATNWGHLTSAMRQGDQVCFRRFYEEFFDFVFQEVVRLSGQDESTCLDIVQETMMKIIRSIKRIDSRSELAAWTRVVTRSVTYDWMRKQRRRRETTFEETAPDVPPAPGTSDSQSEMMDLDARIVWIEIQLRELPSDMQKMISLRYRLGWSLAKIGEQLGMKPGAVDGRIRRTVEKLKRRAESEFAD